MVDVDLAKAQSWQNIKGSPFPGVYRARWTLLSPKPGDLAVSLGRSGAGAIVQLHDYGNRARGMLIKSPGSQLKTTPWSISLAGSPLPETEWMEGHPLDVVIRGMY